ncbi:MAG: excinuclease ABC subunit UvrA [Bacteroidales bacterium]|nr:excinuclease ABC subunit UvrA [Bacteroidales bacterium]MBN2818266.1 excinuclease ABC subunit UvrA [Bacteroidales bacterium]
MPKVSKYIEVKSARVHNLKNIDVNIKRNSFIVITGLSGSGKSSLAFDTIYAEGQRRYVESLSSYARQFLGRMNKPEVDYIRGLPPAIAIEQKVNTRNPRSTVGTSTEIYDYLKLMYARIGKTYSPVSGKEVKKDTVTDVVDHILSFPLGTKMIILSPYSDFKQLDAHQLLTDLNHLGIGRVEIDGELFKTKELSEDRISRAKDFFVVIDRVTVQNDEDSVSRYSDSVQDAFRLGNGNCTLQILSGEKSETRTFTNRFERDGMEFEEPTVHMFSFNNPIGACPVCEGYGRIIGIDEDLVIPDKSLSVFEEAIVCWKGEKMQEWKNELVYNADKFDFPIHKPVYDLTHEQVRLLWTGNRYFAGLNSFFKMLEENKYKIQYRVMLSRYRGRTTCPECNGRRLKKEAGYVKVDKYSLSELVDIPVNKLQHLFNSFSFSEYERRVAKRLIIEIQSRLEYLCDVGLGYLTLNRLSSTLSGGESQRINLATILGSSLVGSLYVLDEPSIGLHPRDTHRLIKVLKKLQELGNTILIVEHEEEIIRAADELIDIGPGAGRLGGEVTFSGNYSELVKNPVCLTGKYLTGVEEIAVPSRRRKWNNSIQIIGAYENNLKGINVKIPLEIITVVTGVSGSGKSSLIKGVLYPAISKIIGGYGTKSGKFSKLEGDFRRISQVEFVDQNPIGKSSRSNPVTYLKAYDEIRKLYSNQQYAKYNGYKPSHFSFNVEGGRCEECQGEGTIKVEMQFMADIVLTCEHCNGKRFKDDVLEVKYQDKSIYDILEMTVNESIEFFGKKSGSTEKKIIDKLKPLADVGLGYVKLGQSSSTLSGGESQRVKLASFLALEKSTPTMFIFDEPTTGLHFHDIGKLLSAFNALVEKGHSIVIIEHNQEVIKSADWVIDLGPGGGDVGGYLVFEGVPEDLAKVEKSYTGKFLKEKLKRIAKP